MRTWIVGLVLVTGCLSTPPPATTDGAVVQCASGARPTAQAWPPAGITVREVRLVDVDGDGQLDLVISAAPDQQQQAGPSRVYVAYGPVSATAPVYHAELDVGAEAEIMAWGFTVEDVDRDGCVDLTVAGPPTQGNSLAFAAVWRHRRTMVPWSGTPVRGALGGEVHPGASPIMPVWIDLTTNAARDLVVARLEHVDLFVGAAAATDALPGHLDVAPPTSCGSWGNLNAAVAQPAASGRERLALFGHYRTNTLEMVADLPDVSDECTDDTARPITRGVAVAELDGVAPLDLLSGGGGWVGAHLLAGAGAPVSPQSGGRACTDTPRGADDFIEGIAAGDLGGTSALEVVLLDRDDGMPGPAGNYACLLSLASVDGSGVVVNARNELSLGSGVARTLAIGDLDGAPRVWVLEAGGGLRCLQRSVGAPTLESCR